MAMTNDAWEELVRKRAQQAKADPRGYRIRVGAWALTGYGVLLAALAVALFGALGIALAIVLGDAPVIAVKLAIPVGVLAWIILRSLAVRIPPPAGIELRGGEAPVLFEAIGRLRKRLATPRLHHVLVDGDFNASVVQIPRLGPLGWQRNYMTLGLPAMQALAPQELEAVLAHELGHISRNHGRFGVWVYRLRNSWASVARELDQRGFVGSGLVRRFVAWYVPRLQAWTLPLVREHEHEADRAAAEAVSARDAASALVRTTALDAIVGEYWESVFRGVNDADAPPHAVFAGLQQALRSGAGPGAPAAMQRALATPTETTASHPSLSERLGALGFAAESLQDALQAPATNAADALLGAETHARLCGQLSSDWSTSIAPNWAARHAGAAQDRAQLEQLDARAAGDTLDLDSARERAELSGVLRGEQAALAAWRDALALDPSDAHCNLAVGVRLLAGGDEVGLRHLDRAIEASPLVAVHAADAGYGYLAGRGRHEEAARYRQRMNRELDVLEAAAAERRGVTRSDTLEPHGLAPEAVAGIARVLARDGRVARAYAARKHVEQLAGEPMYIVAIERATTWWRPERRDRDGQLVRELVDQFELPGEVLAVALAGPTRWLRRRMTKLGGALVYAR